MAPTATSVSAFSSPVSHVPSVSLKASSARAMRRRSSVVNFVGWEKSSARAPVLAWSCSSPWATLMPGSAPVPV